MLSVIGDQIAHEGSPLVIPTIATFSDDDIGDYTYQIDWGDGTPIDSGTAHNDATASLFYTDRGDVYRADLDGGNPRRIYASGPFGHAVSVEVDSLRRKLYYYTLLGEAWTVTRSNFDGSSFETVVSGLAGVGGGMALAGNALWVAVSGGILRMALDGRFPELIPSGPRRTNDLYMDLAASRMYSTDVSVAPGIHRSLSSGVLDETIVPSARSGTSYLAVDAAAGHIYFTETDNSLFGTVQPPAIRRSDLSGQNVQTLLAGVDAFDIEIDLVERKLYWVTADGVERANLDGSSIESLVSLLPDNSVAPAFGTLTSVLADRSIRTAASYTVDTSFCPGCQSQYDDENLSDQSLEPLTASAAIQAGDTAAEVTSDLALENGRLTIAQTGAARTNLHNGPGSQWYQSGASARSDLDWDVSSPTAGALVVDWRLQRLGPIESLSRASIDVAGTEILEPQGRLNVPIAAGQFNVAGEFQVGTSSQWGVSAGAQFDVTIDYVPFPSQAPWLWTGNGLALYLPENRNPSPGFGGVHTYADDGIYMATITLTGPGGAAASGTLKIDVANVAPTAELMETNPFTVIANSLTDNIQISGTTPTINNHGDVAFETDDGVFVANGDTLQIVIDWSEYYDGGFNRTVINDAGVVVTMVSVSPGEFALLRFEPGSGVQEIASTVNSPFRLFSAPAINALGTVVFRAELDTGATGIYAWNQGTISTLYDASGSFASFRSSPTPVINAAGMVAFVAELDSGGLGIFFRNGESYVQIADDAGSYAVFTRLAINDLGAVAFGARLDGSNEAVIDQYDGGTISRRLDASGSFSNVTLLGMTDAGELGFYGTLKDGSSGIFITSGSSTQRMVNRDDLLFGEPISLQSSQYMAMSANGQFAFTADGAVWNRDYILRRNTWHLDEGNALTLKIGSVIDPGTDTVTQWRLDWGDGSSIETFSSPPGDLSHIYVDGPAAHDIVLDLMDEDGAHARAAIVTIHVRSAGPALDAGENVRVSPGSSVTQTGLVTDSGRGALAAHVDYDDDQGFVPLPLDADNRFVLTLNYSTAGLRTVRVKVVDGAGREATDEIQVVVAIPGDLNFDSRVGLRDVAILQSNYGRTPGRAWLDGDLDGDADIDSADHAALVANYGASSQSQSLSTRHSAPKPPTFAALRGHRRRRTSANPQPAAVAPIGNQMPLRAGRTVRPAQRPAQS